MALTSMLCGYSDTDKQFQELVRKELPGKEDFLTVSGIPAFSKYEEKIPYIIDKKDASIVGTTFDYLARFMVARKIKNNKEGAIKNLKAKYGLGICERIMSFDSYNKLKSKYEEAITQISLHINESDFVKNINALIYCAYFLSKLEAVYRSGNIPEGGLDTLLTSPSKEVYQDLHNLCDVFQAMVLDKGIVHENSVVVFNPSFGIGSYLCDGADADIYIDGILYDFKVTKNRGYTWNDVAQLKMYYLLNLIAEIYKKDISGTPAELKKYPIKGVALYKARFGEIEYLNTNYFVTAERQANFQEIINFLFENIKKPKTTDVTFRTSNGNFNYKVRVIIINEGKILAAKNEQSSYYLPGGVVHMGEIAEDAVIRTVQRDLGVTTKIIRPLWLNQVFFKKETNNSNSHELCLYFLVDISGTDLLTKGESFEIKEDNKTHIFEWLKFEQLKDEHFYPEFLKEEIFNLPEHLTLRTELK